MRPYFSKLTKIGLTTKPQKAKLKFLIYSNKKNFPEREVRSRQSHPPAYVPDLMSLIFIFLNYFLIPVSQKSLSLCKYKNIDDRTDSKSDLSIISCGKWTLKKFTKKVKILFI